MKPLSQLVVVDFSRVLAVPFATMILAELGATVIKIEQRGAGDESRGWEPRLSEAESAYFFACNRSKKSVTLNLRHPSARAIARRLAGKADILVENFPVGAMARFGLDYPTLSAEHPRLIYLSNTGFGQSGPYAMRKGYDTIFQAMGGIMSMTGAEGGDPAKAGLPFADLTSGLWSAIAVLTAVVGRGVSGRGAHVDFSMFDAQASLLTTAAARYFALGEVPRPLGTEHPGRVPSAAFKCRDGLWLHITGSDQHWESLCRVLALDDLAGDPTLADNSARVAARERVMTRLRQAVSLWDRPALLAACDAADVPAGPVNTVDQVVADPHILARGIVGRFAHPTVGDFQALGVPLKFAGFDDPEIGRPPLLGEHTDEVLATLLGLTPAEIEALRAEEAI